MRERTATAHARSRGATREPQPKGARGRLRQARKGKARAQPHRTLMRRDRLLDGICARHALNRMRWWRKPLILRHSLEARLQLGSCGSETADAKSDFHYRSVYIKSPDPRAPLSGYFVIAKSYHSSQSPPHSPPLSPHVAFTRARRSPLYATRCAKEKPRRTQLCNSAKLPARPSMRLN